MKEKDPAEIVSLNRELLSFDFDLRDLSIEQLEVRLEMDIIVVVNPTCAVFKGPCGTFTGVCGRFGPGA